MTAFILLGAGGLLLLAVALVIGDHLEGIAGGLGLDWFSTEVTGAFVSALGFGGAAALGAGAPTSAAVGIGIGVGLVFAVLAGWLTRLVRGGGTDETPSAGDVVGYEGRVLSGVPDGGFGSVEIRLGGHTLRFNARAELPLDAGTRVHVTGVLSPTAVTVAPLWSSLPPSD